MMKKFSYLLLSVLLTSIGASSCSDKKSAENDDTVAELVNPAEDAAIAAAEKAKADSLAAKAKADSIAAVQASDEAVIRKIYSALFSDNFNDIKRYCTPGCIRRLIADNEYDEPSPAWWKLRSEAQDGPSNVSKVTSVTPQGDGWYKVSFIDMGLKESKRVKMEGGLLADYK